MSVIWVANRGVRCFPRSLQVWRTNLFVKFRTYKDYYGIIRFKFHVLLNAPAQEPNIRFLNFHFS